LRYGTSSILAHNKLIRYLRSWNTPNYHFFSVYNKNIIVYLHSLKYRGIRYSVSTVAQQCVWVSLCLTFIHSTPQRSSTPIWSRAVN